jgi:hypothetical protein
MHSLSIANYKVDVDGKYEIGGQTKAAAPGGMRRLEWRRLSRRQSGDDGGDQLGGELANEDGRVLFHP